MSSQWQRMTRFRGLMVLVLWQAAPVGVDENGGTRIGFGIGGGTLEYSVVSCDGSTVESRGVGYKHAAAEVEHWVTPNKVRFHASGGYQWSDSISANGPFGTFALGYEGRKFGIGAGVAFLPSSDAYFDPAIPGDLSQAQILPSVSVRGGNRDGVHVRLELLPPAAHTPTEVFRAVIGFNRFSMTRTSGAFGLGVVGAIDEEGSTGVVGELFHPVSPSVLLGGRAYLSPGRENPQTGLTAGVKVQFR